MKKKFIFFVFLSILCLSSYAQKDTVTDIFDLSLEELMQLKVYTATKRSEPITNIPSSIVIMTRKQIQENGWQTLEEILTHVPGMYMINDYLWFGTENFGVRGFFSTGSFNTMIVMVNGVSQKEDWYNSFPFSKINVPVEAIDRIEVIRGPMSVIYGNNAFLGAINIITNESSENIATVNYGTNKQYSGFARISDRTVNLSYTINLGLYGTNGIDVPYANMMSDPTALTSWGLPMNMTSKGQLYDHRKYLGTTLKYKNFYFKSSQTYTNKGVIDYYPGIADGHLAEIQSSNNVLGYCDTVSDKLNLNLKLGYYSFRNRLDYKHNSDTTAYGFNDIYSDATDVEVNINYLPIENLNTFWGAYLRYIHRDKLVVDAPNLSDNYINLDAGLARKDFKMNWAVFMQSTYTIMKKIHIIGGIRLEQTPKYDISYMVRFDPQNHNANFLYRTGTYEFDDVLIIPRAAILYNITPIHHLKLMYGMAVREPSIGENMDVVRYPDRPQLKPAYMNTLELNYIGLISNYTSLNFSVFKNNVNNLISRTNTMQDGVMQLYNTNSGKLQTLGAELSIMIKVKPRFTARISTTYQQSKNLKEGYDNITLEYSPQLLTYLTTSYRFWKDHTISLSGYYVDQMETYWNPSSTSLDPKDGSRIGKKSPAYFVGNVNFRFNNLFKRGIYCFAYAYNIFDTKIKYPTTRSNDKFDLGTFGNSRNILIGTGIKF